MFFFIRFRGLDDVYDLMIRDKGSFNSKTSSYSLFSMAGYHQPWGTHCIDLVFMYPLTTPHGMWTQKRAKKI